MLGIILFDTLARIFIYDHDGVTGQIFEFAGAQIALPKLDVIHANARSFGYFGQQIAATGAFIAAKLASVSNVIEQATGRHRSSVY
jgi:hypothetical protein